MEPDQALNDAHNALADEDLGDEEALRRMVDLLFASHSTWSWVGMYLLVGDTLVLGPYAGAPTEHIRIPVGTGVCGMAVEQGRNLVIGNVKVIENYLACSPEVQSEMVLLIRDGDDIVGQIDVDSDELDAFSPEDLDSLRPLAQLAGVRCRRLAGTLS